MTRSTLVVVALGLLVAILPNPAPAAEVATAAPEAGITAGAGSRTGLHYWIDFVSTARGAQTRHGDALVRRLAHSVNLGFGWEGELFSVRVTDSVAEYGQFLAAGGSGLVNTIAPLTNPSVVCSLRPAPMLRLDAEVDLLWAFDLQNGPGDFSYTSVFGGFFAVLEPLARFVGDFPLIEIGLGARGGMAWTDADKAPAGLTFEASRVMTGLRFRVVLPFKSGLGQWSHAGFFMGGGYFVDPIAGYGATEMFKKADAEWTLGLRWFL